MSFRGVFAPDAAVRKSGSLEAMGPAAEGGLRWRGILYGIDLE